MNESVSQPILLVEGLGKSVASLDPETDEKLVILRDITLTIGRGESVAIVGPSGSGKSTLLGLLAGLDAPTAGRIHLGGVDMVALDEDARAELRGSKLGFVFQSFQLLATFTALENVMLPMELSPSSETFTTTTGMKKRAEQLLARVGLSNRMQHYPNQLSGGEQQRVAIARAFASNPELLFADEPTGNLDAGTGQRIIELMFELNAEQQTTLVLVTHDQSLASRCNRILTLHEGRLLPKPESPA